MPSLSAVEILEVALKPLLPCVFTVVLLMAGSIERARRMEGSSCIVECLKLSCLGTLAGGC